MFEDSTINGAIVQSSVLPGSGQLTNAAAQSGLYPGAVHHAVGSAAMSQLAAYNNALMARQHKPIPRATIEVDKVSNGFVLRCGGEALIAKDLEELQGLFIAQIATMCLEDK